MTEVSFYIGNILEMLVSEPIFPKAILRRLRDGCINLRNLSFYDFVEDSGTFIKGNVVFEIEGSKTSFTNNF